MRLNGFACGWVYAVAAIVSAGAGSLARAQDYPSKQIVMVVPFAAGGPTDVVARQIGDNLSKTLGRQIVVETTTGAGGTVGAERVAKAAPDGYTVLIHHNGLPTAPALYANLRYDTRTAFEPVGLVNTGPMMVVAKKSAAANTLKELFDQWAGNAENVTLGHAGVGSTSYMCGLQINNVIGKKLRYVTYRGTAPSLNDVVAGQIDGMCDLSTSALPQVLGGTIKVLAVTGDQRLEAIKDVPTTKEAGFPRLDMTIYNALYVPAGTPAPIIARLSEALNKALVDPDIVEKFRVAGTSAFPPAMRTPEALRKFFLEQMESQAEVFRAAGVVPGKGE